MSKRLAITIAGAVSLGSYEAGVLYEIVEALRQHNTNPATSDDERIHIDVITGASAGAMTATIAAQKLLFEANSLTDPYKNSFYQPWVADISLDLLFKFHKDEVTTHSLFSSDLIEEIADRHMTARYRASTAPARSQHAAAADTIHLGLALSNLNGVDYARPIRGTSEPFTYTRHQDQLLSILSAQGVEHDTLEKWKPLCAAAVSSGAFPIAFRVKELSRSADNYPSRYLQPFVPSVQNFTYTDGGVLQNEPLGMAKNFVDRIDNHRDNDNRFYLFVAPGAKSGSRETNFSARDASMLKTTCRLAKSIYTQSRFQDWVTAEDLNEKIALFNSQALALHSCLIADPANEYYINTANLGPASTDLLDSLFRATAGQILKETRGDAWARLQAQFRKEYDQLSTAKGKAAADIWIDSILTFETAAQLGPRDEMTIYGITASDLELASEKFFAFGGFFDRRFREHDYNVGRKKAQAWLLSQAGQADGEIGPIRFTPKPLPELPDLANTELADLPVGSRKQLRQRIIERANDFLEDLKLPSVAIFAIRNLLLKPEINKRLEL